MIRRTFCHLNGISEKKEQELWEAGVHSWDVALPATGIKLSKALRANWPDLLELSRGHHEDRNLHFFEEGLPAKQSWRLYQEFQEECAFVDIETTGLESAYCEITTIMLYDGKQLRHYINGVNLPEFLEDVKRYRLLVTYNGKSFDIPFIERFFKTQITHAHIDVMHPLRQLGIRGGLKGCEEQLKIKRPGVEGVDGFLAVLLWNQYKLHKNQNALQTLLAYNAHDTISLHQLMVHTHNMKIAITPFQATDTLPMPERPVVVFQPDVELVKKLRGKYYPSSNW